MAHVRKQIRDAFVTAVTGLATTGDNVLRGRFQPLVDLPGLRITTGDESIDDAVISDPILDRSLDIVVEVGVKSAADADDTIDQVVLELEEAIAADVTLGGKASTVRVSSITREDDGSAEQDAVLATITFRARYFTHFTTPDTLA